MKELIKARILKWFQQDFIQNNADIISVVLHALILLLICWAIYWVVKRIVIDRVHRLAVKTQSKWDDELMEARFFRRIVLLIPLLILRYSVDAVLADYHTSVPFITKMFEVLIALAVMRIVIAFVNALQSIMSSFKSFKDKPIQSYAQIVKIIIYIFFGIMLFSIITGKTPMFFLTAMGAMSAILILVFKDTILGFIGSIQLASNDMVRIGDWITMSKYGADGTVSEINLATIKVRNFDLTITTIPTYALISDSFKNWRGMEESEGRRIKRAVRIKTSSIQFCDKQMLDRFEKIDLLSDYIASKRDLLEYSADELDKINGRQLTNVGVFRVYLENYLHNHPMVNNDLTCMVRQLEVDSHGLPMEIYAFSKDKAWVNYEGIMADIFDHVLATIKEFDLEIFQSPTGSDLKHLA